MATLLRRNPTVSFDVFTRVPRWFFDETLPARFAYHSVLTDIGLVQRTTLEEDIPATIVRLDSFLPFDGRIVDDLAAQLLDSDCRLVLCDIAPLGITVARAANIPSVLVENFTWDWIYAGYAEEYPVLWHHVAYLRDRFAEADYHVQTEPVCHPAVDAITAPPISRSPRTSARETRRRLGVATDTPLVLLTMGGIAWNYTFLDRLAERNDVRFVIPGVDEPVTAPSNVTVLRTDSDLYHPDLTSASDVVVGKAGYSTMAEVFHAGVPFGYIVRPQFRESPVMARFLDEHVPGIAFDPEEFASGDWVRRLPELLAIPRVRRSEPNGATHVAAFVEALLDRGASDGGTTTDA